MKSVRSKSFSTQEAADILHVSKFTIYELIKRGKINSYKLGCKVQFTQNDDFRKDIQHFSGNDYRDLGKIIAEV